MQQQADMFPHNNSGKQCPACHAPDMAAASAIMRSSKGSGCVTTCRPQHPTVPTGASVSVSLYACVCALVAVVLTRLLLAA
jgi:hypothetical protein